MKKAKQICESIETTRQALRVRKLIADYEDGRLSTTIKFSSLTGTFLVETQGSRPKVMTQAQFIKHVQRLVATVYKQDAIASYGDVFGPDGFHEKVKSLLKLK